MQDPSELSLIKHLPLALPLSRYRFQPLSIQLHSISECFLHQLVLFILANRPVKVITRHLVHHITIVPQKVQMLCIAHVIWVVKLTLLVATDALHEPDHVVTVHAWGLVKGHCIRLFPDALHLVDGAVRTVHVFH